jgi:hypothetical protein
MFRLHDWWRSAVRGAALSYSPSSSSRDLLALWRRRFLACLRQLLIEFTVELPKSGRGASGRGRCGTQQNTRIWMSRYVTSFSAKAASTNAQSGLPDAWGEVDRKPPAYDTRRGLRYAGKRRESGGVIEPGIHLSQAAKLSRKAGPPLRSNGSVLRHGFHVALHIGVSVPFMREGCSVSRYSSDRPKRTILSILGARHEKSPSRLRQRQNWQSHS